MQKYGCGSKLSRRGYAGFLPCFHFIGVPFWYRFLSHCHMSKYSTLKTFFASKGGIAKASVQNLPGVKQPRGWLGSGPIQRPHIVPLVRHVLGGWPVESVSTGWPVGHKQLTLTVVCQATKGGIRVNLLLVPVCLWYRRDTLENPKYATAHPLCDWKSGCTCGWAP